LPGGQISPICLSLERDGLRDGNAGILGRELHRTGGELAPPPFGSVGLSQYAHDRVA
jgi:hypothetical protein